MAICGVVRCEVGRGIREQRMLRRFQRSWDVMINVPTDNRLWRDVGDTLWQLDRTGVMVPLSGVIIACCARRIDALVLTFDEHFRAIPGVRTADHLDY